MQDILENLKWYKKIEVLRVIKGWSQAVAASECNTSQKMYWLWENGKTYPRRINQRSIARAFNVKVDDIFDVGGDNNG